MKKLTLSILALILTVGVSYGQLREVDDGGTPNEDYVPESRMVQHEAFLDGEYSMPAKPRNMWVVGLEGGYSQISGDVRPEFGWNAGINFRKALGYATSLRFGVNYQENDGRDEDDERSTLWTQKYNAMGSAQTGSPGDTYVHGFENKVWFPYGEIGLNLNNINFHREQTDWNFNVTAGAGAYMWKTETEFNDLNGQDVAVNLQESQSTRNEGDIGDFYVVPAATFSGAVSYRAGDRVSLYLQPRYVRTWEDWIDGERFSDISETGAGEDNVGDESADKDANFSTNLGIEIALGNSEKRVQPLWWENPLNFTYPYLQDTYEFDDDYLFEDSDGDGVQDRLDKEPDSPCSFVDGGGVAIDSDKDGIVDCNDACPFTPAAQIADIDENGCTEIIDKNCCDEIDELRRMINERPVTATGCENLTYPSVTFASNSKSIPAAQNAQIQSIASQLSANPTCRVVIEGFATGRRKVAQQVAWARAKAVADALANTYGISRDRMIVRYSGVDGYGDVVMVRSARAGESGSSNPAAPFPGN